MRRGRGRSASRSGRRGPGVKANYGIPEIWAAGENEAAMRAVAEAVRGAGFRVVVAPGSALAAIPPHELIYQLAIMESGLDATAGSRRVSMDWDQPILGVYYTPRPPEGPSTGARRLSTAVRPEIKEHGAACDVPFVELGLLGGGPVIRLAVLADLTKISGLTQQAGSNPSTRLAQLVRLCEERFKRGRFDRRLVRMQLRPRIAPAPTGTQYQRKGFAFGSRALADLLANVAPDLLELTQCDYAARLVQLTWQFADG